jgi:hypothetical protein
MGGSQWSVKRGRRSRAMRPTGGASEGPPARTRLRRCHRRQRRVAIASLRRWCRRHSDRRLAYVLNEKAIVGSGGRREESASGYECSVSPDDAESDPSSGFCRYMALRLKLGVPPGGALSPLPGGLVSVRPIRQSALEISARGDARVWQPVLATQQHRQQEKFDV